MFIFKASPKLNNGTCQNNNVRDYSITHTGGAFSDVVSETQRSLCAQYRTGCKVGNPQHRRALLCWATCRQSVSLPKSLSDGGEARELHAILVALRVLVPVQLHIILIITHPQRKPHLRYCAY